MNPTKAPTRRKEARPPDAGSPKMRRFTLLSLGIHVLFVSLFSLSLIQPLRPVPAEPIYEVALIQWPEPNYEPPKPVRPPEKKKEPEKPKPEPKKPKPEDAVVVPKSEPKPKPPPEPKQAEEPVPEKTPVPIQDAPEEPVSMGEVDQKDFKHDYYLQQVRRILARAWDPPSGGTGLVEVGLHFIIDRTGAISALEVSSTSGWNLYDRAALSAVLSVKKLPPLPESYAGDQLGLTVNFQRMGDAP